MIVNSNCPEFGYELLSALPYAYSLHLKGELSETISAYDTSCLYFFSPKHTETNCRRSWDNMNQLWDTKFPNINIHRPELDWDFFSPPPLKEFYKDKSIDFDKEKIIIFNRYNKEWGGPPINYLDLETLDKLFELLSDNYQVIYVNLNKNDKYFDGANPLYLNDDSVLKKYPKVLTIYNVLEQNPTLTYNEVQLRLFSNCTKYISSNGGQLILSAYFGGENIIFSRKCRELNPNVNSFYRWYNKLGNGVFQHVDNYNDLITLVTEKWVEKRPLINILIRTSGRPNYFKNCVNSIYSQTYKNWNIIVGVDDTNSKKYVQPNKCQMIDYDYSNYIYPIKPNSDEYGIGFKYNLYLNHLQDEVNDGFVMYLDDDDILYSTESLKLMTNSIQTENDLIFWRVKFPNRLVPSDKNFNNRPKMRDISGIGFAFHIKYKTLWEPFKRGDFRVANFLYDRIPNKRFLNKIITGLQREVEDGFGRRDDIVSNLSIIIPTYKNTEYIDECINSILKSGENHNIELLIGVDACQETLYHIKTKEYPDFVKFYYFNENVGPYVIKNSLLNITNSENILFFDSDDIIAPDTIPNIINNLSQNDCVLLLFQTITNNIVNNDELNFAAGVFAIKKDLILKMNGFEPWRVSADSEFIKRLHKHTTKIHNLDTLGFYYRQHPNSLTKRRDTGMTSKLRREYGEIKKDDNNPSTLYVADFTNIDFDSFVFPDVIEVKPNIDLTNILRTQPRPIVKKQPISTPIYKPKKSVREISLSFMSKPKPI